jgi:hypothetical protein
VVKERVELHLYSPYGPYGLYSRAIPLLPLWAVRPVQSLSACTRVTFTFLTEAKNKWQNISALYVFVVMGYYTAV